MKNKDLKQIYDKGELNFHSGFNESMMLISMIDDWQGKSVLEIGCGEGHLCSILAYAGAEIYGIDYSEEQIKRAKGRYPKSPPYFSCDSPKVFDKKDIVVMQGVLEHFNHPWDDLSWIMDNLLTPDAGVCILSVPNWVNPRGYIYHTLRLLFNAKMSLTDIHFFLPDEFFEWAETKQDNIIDTSYGLRGVCGKYEIIMKSCDYSWAAGDEMIADLKERIPKAMDFRPPRTEHIEKLMDFAQRQAQTWA
jgi:2-polyprenyl-3-methyl-5-hydroxy-6-metoxy-1,4-benzoquinol methylase